MATNTKYSFKKFFAVIAWVVLVAGTVVLLVAAISKRNSERCAGVEIYISGVQNNFFIDKEDVASILQKINGSAFQKKKLHTIDLALMENELQKSKWIKRAELFFDNNNVLQVRITEREPIARIFTTSGTSYYMDSSLARLPLSDKFSARLPVFTDFPTDAVRMSKKDSALVREIKVMSEFIEHDPFWMAQIDQVDITPDGNFDLIPKLGDQVIHFGDAENYKEKFNNLLCFYKQVLTKLGWTHYSSISVQFKGQVVGVRRGANEIKMDSLRSVQIMKSLIADAQKQTNDSTHVQLLQPDDDNTNINQSKEVENIPDENVKQKANDADEEHVPVTPIPVPESTTGNSSSTKKNSSTSHSSSIEKPGAASSNSKRVKQEIQKKAQTEKRIPKAVMPAKTDY